MSDGPWLSRVKKSIHWNNVWGISDIQASHYWKWNGWGGRGALISHCRSRIWAYNSNYMKPFDKTPPSEVCIVLISSTQPQCAHSIQGANTHPPASCKPDISTKHMCKTLCEHFIQARAAIWLGSETQGWKTYYFLSLGGGGIQHGKQHLRLGANMGGRE